MVFTDDKGREFCFEQEGVNVWRSSFDSWLATKTKEIGAEIRDETIAVLCEENCEGVESVYANYQQNTKKLKLYMERQWRLVGGMADTFKEMK